MSLSFSMPPGNPKPRGKVFAIIKSLIKSAMVSALIIAFSFFIRFVLGPTTGMFVMVVLSSIMMLRSFRREMPLSLFTAVLPGLMSLACFALQYIFFFGKPWNSQHMIALCLGLLLGSLSAFGSQVERRGPVLFVHRTYLYIFIWAATFCFGQLSAVLGWRQMVGFASAFGMGSTAMVVTLSLALSGKFFVATHPARPHSVSLPPAAAVLFWLTLLPSFFMVPNHAGAETAQEAADTVLRKTELRFDAITSVDVLNTQEGRERQERVEQEVREMVANTTRQLGCTPPLDCGVWEAQDRDLIKLDSVLVTVLYFETIGDVQHLLDSMLQQAQAAPEGGRFSNPGIGNRSFEILEPVGGHQCVHTLTFSRGNWVVTFLAITNGPPNMDPAAMAQFEQQSVAEGRRLGRLIDSRLKGMRYTGPLHRDGGTLPQDTTGRVSRDSGSGAVALLPDEAAEALRRIREQLESRGNLTDEAIAAGLIAALLQLLAGTGVAAAMAAAQAAATAATNLAASATPLPPPQPPLIDPRDGLELEAWDGQDPAGRAGQVYWDDDEGWIDRSTAEQWIAEINAERAARDVEVDRFWNEVENDYSRRMNYLINHRPPEINGRLQHVYDLEDFIDWNYDYLTPDQQRHLDNILAGLDFSDPYNFSNDALSRLERAANAVRDLRIGARESEMAARDHRDIDREWWNHYLRNVGYGTARFGLSAINPLLGVAASGAFGFANAPEGSEVSHAMISALAGGLDVYTGGRLAQAYANGQLSSSAMVALNTLLGGSIAAGEQAALGGSWEDIERGFLFGGTMNGFSSAMQIRGVQRAFQGLDDTIDARLFGPGSPELPVVRDYRPVWMSDGASLDQYTLPERAYIISRAAHSTDLADRLAPLRNGGRNHLGLLEEGGGLTPQATRSINTAADAAVDDAVRTSAPEAMARFENEFGVKVTKVVVGDSGSSSGPGSTTRSILTDNDRTFVPVFDKNDVIAYARRTGLRVDDAHAQLVGNYRQIHHEGATGHLRRVYNVSDGDVDFSTYEGIGPASTPDDTYGAGQTRIRQSLGRGEVIRPDGRSYRIDGDGVNLAEGIQRERFWRTGGVPDSEYGDLRYMTTSDYERSLDQQGMAGRSLNPDDYQVPQIKKAAKAVSRAAEALDGLGRGGEIDDRVLAISRDIKKHPDRIAQILNKNNLDHREFVTLARDELMPFSTS